MSATPLFPVKTGIVARLTGNVLLDGLAVPIFDYVPGQNQPFPYVALGAMTFQETDVAEWTVGVAIGAWTQVQGLDDIASIVDQIIGILELEDIDLGTGWSIEQVIQPAGGSVAHQQGDARGPWQVGTVQLNFQIQGPEE